MNTHETMIGGKLQTERNQSEPKSFERRIEGRHTARKTLGSDKIKDISAGAIANNSLNYALFNSSQITVTVAAGATTGSSAVTTGWKIIGYYPVAQDQIVKSIAISGSTLTVTLLAAATAQNQFIVTVIAP